MEKQIIVEQSAVKALFLINNNKNVFWTAENLLTKIKKYGQAAIDWLMNEGYLHNSNGLIITDEGEKFLKSLGKKNIYYSDGGRFKDEALCGLSEIRNKKSGFIVSQRTSINNAVVPRGKKQHESITPEQIALEHDRQIKAKKQLAKRLKITVDELTTFIEIGRVRYCKRCKSVEIFDRKTFNRWHHVCRKCRKIQRKEERLTKSQQLN